MKKQFEEPKISVRNFIGPAVGLYTSGTNEDCYVWQEFDEEWLE